MTLGPILLSLVLLGAAIEPLHADPGVPDIAQEARQTIAVIDWFYVRHRACPQPTAPAELVELQDGLGDGFSVDLEGRFAAIRGISMSGVWLYYASPAHPEKCTLWRKLTGGAAVIWRRNRSGGQWSFLRGGGGREQRLGHTPSPAADRRIACHALPITLGR